MRDPLQFLTELARKHGDVVPFAMGRQPAVLMNDPALIQRVIHDRSFERSAATRRALDSFLGPGLLSLEGVTHRQHRRLMAPAFHRERIQRYVALMADETYAVLDRWRVGETRDLRADMMHLTFAIVARALFSTETSNVANRVDEAVRRVSQVLLPYAMLSRLVKFELPIVYGPRARAAIAQLNALVRGIVVERRAEKRDRGDLLSMLLATRDEDGAALSDEDICAEALTIMLAGHDTTAHTMTWAWFLLSQHPQLQQLLVDEVQSVVGDRQITAEDLPRLTFADRVMRETLRLYPPSWWADRVSQTDAELAGYFIPANTLMVFSTWVTQRDDRWFAKAARFDPDRFLPDRATSIPEGAYLPFGAGVHVCIGNTFALMEGRMILAAMAQRFAYQAVRPQQVRPKPLITLGMAEPFPVAVRARSNPAANVVSASHA
jgi:cytochrome P450